MLISQYLVFQLTIGMFTSFQHYSLNLHFLRFEVMIWISEWFLYMSLPMLHTYISRQIDEIHSSFTITMLLRKFNQLNIFYQFVKGFSLHGVSASHGVQAGVAEREESTLLIAFVFDNLVCCDIISWKLLVSRYLKDSKVLLLLVEIS